MTKQVEVVATARGFDSATARTRNEGDTFLVDEAVAEEGASWFRRVGEKAAPAAPKPLQSPQGQAGDGRKPSPSEPQGSRPGDATDTLLGARDDGGASLV